MRARMAAASVAVMLALPVAAGAQDLGFLSGFFGKAHTLALYLSTAALKNKDVITDRNSSCLSDALCGAGVELLLDLSSPSQSNAHVELGFSANYLRGFEATDRSIAIRGALRSFPVISAYITDLAFPSPWLAPYVGLSFGLSDLWNARIYGSDSVPTSAKGTTFEYGPTLGMQIGDGSWNGNMFVETGFRFRKYSGLEYGTSNVVKQFPRDLDASGFFVNAGFAFSLRDEQAPPEFEGTWVLTKVNGLPVPATLVQSRPAPGTSSVRVELIRASLELRTEPACFVAEFQKRELTFEGQVQVSVRLLPVDTTRGSWTLSDDGALELRPAAVCDVTPPGSAQVRRIRRENDEIVWPASPMSETTLHFAKVKT